MNQLNPQRYSLRWNDYNRKHKGLNQSSVFVLCDKTTIWIIRKDFQRRDLIGELVCLLCLCSQYEIE